MSLRFSRTEMLIGRDGLDKLRKSRVAVFGVGGVGSFAVEALARAGIGSLVMVDFDNICETNINRQIHALTSTVGEPKVQAMKARVLDINPDIRVEAIQEFYTPENGARLVDSETDYIIDAIDNVTAKIDLIKNSVKKGISIVSAMGAGNKMDPAGFEAADISETSVCPLARVVRRELRNAGILKGVKVVYSREQPMKPDTSWHREPDEKNERIKQVPGSISFVPPVLGLILAGIVVRDILGSSEKAEL